MEGGIGPVAGSSHHSLYHRMPGIKIASPMTSKEYEEVYEEFMKNDDVVYVSEHRGSYSNTEEFEDTLHSKSDIVLFPISITRFEAEKAKKKLEEGGFKVSIIHQKWIKPFVFKEEWKNCLINSTNGGIVLDDDYEDGVSKCIAQEMMLNTGKKVYTLGLKNRTAGFHKKVDNLPPSASEISNFVLGIINEK